MSEEPLCLMSGGARGGREKKPQPLNHPRVESKANLKSISHRCHLFEVAFAWELTEEIIHLPPGCLQDGFDAEE